MSRWPGRLVDSGLADRAGAAVLLRVTVSSVEPFFACMAKSPSCAADLTGSLVRDCRQLEMGAQ